jgi:hypothetical protein
LIQLKSLAGRTFFLTAQEGREAMDTPLGLIGKNRPMTAISPHAAQAELITTAAQEIASVNSMVNASRWQNPMSKFYAESKTA